ncbi:hypothetical protein Ahy_B07g087556 [Arachis hypogaea]|uniref:Uncharacterized protein n=1 Tax=Arachis hypogaea TaxID=3818 RepID=A0A444YCG0_ARAHY|nr:hypothetical protein Ahy_B07g087556 [Arachis hypogaea]
MEQVDLQKAVEKEFEMALQDRVMEETKYKKNAVEAYVYEMRNKMRLIFSLFLPNFKYKCPLFDLNDKYQDFVTAPEREDFSARLQQVEDWLYEDGEDETKGLLRNLKNLKSKVILLKLVIKNTQRGAQDAAMSSDPKFDHIDINEKQKVLNECVEVEKWLREKKQQQESLPKYANPVLLSAEIRKAEAVDRVLDVAKLKEWIPEPEVRRITSLSSPLPWKADDEFATYPGSEKLLQIKQERLNDKQPLEPPRQVGENTDPAAVSMSIRTRGIKILSTPLKKVIHNTGNNSMGLLVKWHPPHENFIKVNVDGSFMTSLNNAMCGGVL